MTTLFSVFNNSSTSLRRNCCRFGGVFVAGCTGNCHADNSHCARLRELCRNGDFISFSFLGITFELFDEFAYWLLNYPPSFYYHSLIIHPPSIIVLRYHLVFYFTLFYFHVFHFKYRKVSNIRRTKCQNLNDSPLVLQLSVPNPVKPSVKSIMKM